MTGSAGIRTKWLIGLLNLAIWFVGYFSLNRFPFEDPSQMPLTFVDALPLMPWSIAIYASCWVQCGLAIFAMPSARAAWRYFGAIAIAYAINYACFAWFPTRLPAGWRAEADPESMHASFAWGYAFMQHVDQPVTCFPSLHVTNCVLVAVVMWPSRRRWVWLAWSAVIALSTVTTRQHVSLDIAGGVVVGLLGSWIAARLFGSPWTHARR